MNKSFKKIQRTDKIHIIKRNRQQRLTRIKNTIIKKHKCIKIQRKIMRSK